jgi:class 3 adenylate cyclase
VAGSRDQQRAEAARPEAAATTTFLFADMEGSTRLLQDLGDAYAAVLERYRAVLRDAVSRGGGGR